MNDVKLQNLDDIEKEVTFYALCELSVDWIGLREFLGLVLESIGESREREIINISVVVLKRLMDKGILIPGEIQSEFVAWDLSTTEALNKIHVKLDQMENIFTFDLGEICWINCPSNLVAYAKYLFDKYALGGEELKEIYDQRKKEILDDLKTIIQ